MSLIGTGVRYVHDNMVWKTCSRGRCNADKGVILFNESPLYI